MSNVTRYWMKKYAPTSGDYIIAIIYYYYIDIMRRNMLSITL
jgi:hypothetical protein